MKRRDFIEYLKRQGCLLYREGAKHSVFINKKNNKTSTIPRHNEVDNFLAIKICRDLDIGKIKKK